MLSSSSLSSNPYPNEIIDGLQGLPGSDLGLDEFHESWTVLFRQFFLDNVENLLATAERRFGGVENESANAVQSQLLFLRL